MSEEILLTTFSQLRNRLMRLSRRFLRNEDDASDALQEAFCRLWPRRQTIRSPREAEALTVTTVRNVCINVLRRQAAAPTVDLNVERNAPATSGDEWAEREALFREVENLISTRLTPTQRHILRRREFDGASFDTLAAELSLSPAAVRMQLSRARKTIRECYQQQSHD